MKKLLVLSLIFGLLGACDVSEPQSPPSTPAGNVIVSASNRQVPADWREIIVDTSSHKLSYLIPRDWIAGTHGYVSMDRTATVVTMHNPSDYSFETDMQINISALKEDPELRIVLSKPVFPNGFQGLLTWYQNDSIFVQQLSVKNGLEVYSLACGTFIKTIHPNQKICQDIVESLMFF